MVPLTPSLSIFAVLGSSLVYTPLFVNAQDGTGDACPSGQEYAVLDVQVDDNAAEIGWSLICDGVTVWDVSSGDLSDEIAGSWIHSEYCPVANTNICNFTIFDEGEDGFTGDYGYFVLKYGAQTIASSDYESITPFSELKYCFGPTCDIPPLEREFVWESPFANKNNTDETEGDNTDEEEDESNGWTATVSIKDPNNTTDGQEDSDGVDGNNSTDTKDPTSGQSDKSIDSADQGNGSVAVTIVSILAAIVVGLLAYVLCKRYRQRDIVPPVPSQSLSTETADEKTKEGRSNVQPSATLITKDSCDNTTVAEAV